jgi:large subunit ribosomal protein L2
MIWYDFSNITTDKPHKPLTKYLGRTWGRNNQWRVTNRFRGWGHKRLYRMIDFRWYDKLNISGKVATIEYDPYRTCRIWLINFVDGEKRYVLARNGIQTGQTIMTWDQALLSEWNRKQLKDIPEWYFVYNVEFTPFTKGKIIRSAWWYATITGKDELAKKVFLKLQSGEVRKFDEKCYATIGKIGNEEHKNVVIGKAGRSAWKGRKWKVLGKSMNPVDHPHGGWEWHATIGLKRWPKAFNGRLVAAGIKTRSSKKRSNVMIVSRRKSKKSR